MVESASKTDILTKIFRLKSASAGWTFLVDWYSPKSISVMEEWTEKSETITMHKGEEPMRCFARVD